MRYPIRKRYLISPNLRMCYFEKNFKSRPALHSTFAHFCTEPSRILNLTFRNRVDDETWRSPEEQSLQRLVKLSV